MAGAVTVVRRAGGCSQPRRGETMMTDTASRWNVRSSLALLAGLTGLLLGALPAQAQEVCGDLGDMSNETVDLYLDELEDEFGVDLNDPELCTELTKNFIKA